MPIAPIATSTSTRICSTPTRHFRRFCARPDGYSMRESGIVWGIAGFVVDLVASFVRERRRRHVDDPDFWNVAVYDDRHMIKPILLDKVRGADDATERIVALFQADQRAMQPPSLTRLQSSN